MENVRKEMASMKEVLKGKAPATIDELIQRADHPFTIEIMARSLPDKFKPPQMEMFDEGKDPLDHLEAYKTYMSLHAAPDEIIYKVFPTMIKGPTKVWFGWLKSRSISNFTELSRQFVGYFINSQHHLKPATHLLNIKQNRGESLWDYMS